MSSAADAVIRGLRQAGVRTLFGVPGGGANLDMIEAARLAGLPFVLTATETAAALAALAQAEVTGAPGACLTTLGPGAASVVNGVACAWLDRAPLLVFTDSHPPEAAECTHQRLDHRAVLGPVTKWSTTLSPADAEETVARALQIAIAEPKGPVHLDCPGGAGAPPRHGDRAVLAFAASEPQESELPAALARASRPLLLAGLGARDPEIVAAMRAFCDRNRVPAMVTYKAKGVVPDGHDWFAGVFTHGAVEQPVIDESDLLIGVGLDPVELLPRTWIRAQPIVSLGRYRIHSRQVPFAWQFVGDVAAALDAVDSRNAAWDGARLRSLVGAQRQAIRFDAPGLTPDRVVERAARRLAAVGRVTVDAGAHMFPATMLWPVDAPGRMLISNGLSTMGFALPAAIGAALADRDRPVVALTGDGGLLMCLGELLTAVRERLRIIVIVFDDRSLSLIDIKQQARRLHAAGVALGPLDWPKLAESCGVAGFAAATEAELDAAIDRAMAGDGPSLIAARVDPSVYGRMLTAIRG